MPVTTAAGTRIYIGPRLTADLPKDLAAAKTLLVGITYTQIGEVENIGDYGDEVGDVTFAALADSRTRHLKGLADAGSVDLSIGLLDDDAGQIALQAAQKDRSRFDYPIKVEYESGYVDYFAAKVMSSRKQVGGAEDVLKRAVTIGINSEIIEVEPTP
ncbi:MULTISPECIES: phage tail tube protein [Pseudomonas]|jgi:hypothetical protein|uniref:Phage tail tube protein n=1 Tax=Pseudomonas juntendi TaxID=2666183 RepID=A0ABZ2JLT7_9PSED|nr:MULTISPECIES: phage tail tube protein [Pseudomonas]WHL26687.1 phage tail tube protein [Pseudomonas juntendi]EKT4504149.1 hypothetical protein [Pseudomonas putida]ELU0814677.1 hypothetical protein [Pseudomonas putida]MCE0961803.1 hypothetical protein [Pseudomonas putida]MDD1987202.1 hypothetical protein [Pseudomonas putida]